MAIQDRYALLSSIVRIANSAALSYSARLKALTRFLEKSLNLHSVTIYLLDGESRRFCRYITSAGSGGFRTCSLPVGEGTAGRCAARRQMVRLVPEGLHPEEFRGGQETEFVAIPLSDRGVITLGVTAGQFATAPEMALVRDLLAPLDGLLQRLRLAEESERRVLELTRLNALGQILNRPLPPLQMFPLILDACLSHSDSSCVVLRLSEGRGLPAGTFKKCRSAMRSRVAKMLEIEAAASVRVLECGTPVLVADLIAEGDFPPSYVCVPLQFKVKTLGTLTFFGKRGGRGQYCNFDEEDRDIFESVAMLVATALAEAVNYEHLVLLSEENDKKVKELSLLYRISNVMLSTIRLNKLVHLILTALVSGTPSSFGRAMLFLINERSGIMQGMLGVTRESAQRSLPEHIEADSVLDGRWEIGEEEMARQLETDFCRCVRASRLQMNKALNVCSRAVAEKRVIMVPDPAREKRIDRDFVRNFGLSSFAVAPLMAKEQVLGVVLVDNPGQGRPITEDDLHFLQLFTNQAGMAIENSMLYNRLEDANRSLRDARERMIHGARLATIGEMAATLAHELKGPLVSIGGFARRLEKRLPQGTSESESAMTIVREVQRLERMLTDILSYAKKTTICYNHCNIIDILEECLAIVGPALEEKDIRVEKNFPRKMISFLGDGQQLKQVFINLFLNSHEAMQCGGVIRLSVGSARLSGARAVSIKVVDTGGGVPAEVINQIFTPFYTTKKNGTGLGLPIANRIVANHGGTIQVNNRDGGAEFNVILPLVN